MLRLKLWLSLSVLLVAAASGAPTNCEVCQWAASQLEAILNQRGSVSQWVQFVQTRVCLQSGVLDNKCAMVAETLIPEVMKWLKRSEMPAQLCLAASVCDGANLAHLAKSDVHTFERDHLLEDTMCSMCDHVISSAMTLQPAPLDESSFEAAALVACDEFSGDLSAACARMVRMYAPQIMAGADLMDSWGACAMAGLCTSQALDHLHVPALPPTLVEVIAQLKQGTAANSNMCDMCHLTVLELNTLVSNPAVQQQITNYTKTLCESLGASAADTCKFYVDIYGPAVFVMLKQYLQPDPICQSVGMCNATAIASTTKPKLILPGATLNPAHLRGQEVAHPAKTHSQFMELADWLTGNTKATQTTTTPASNDAQVTLASLHLASQTKAQAQAMNMNAVSDVALVKASKGAEPVSMDVPKGVASTLAARDAIPGAAAAQEEEDVDDMTAIARMVSQTLDNIMYGESKVDSVSKEDEEALEVGMMLLPLEQEDTIMTHTQGTQTHATTVASADLNPADQAVWSQHDIDAWGSSYYDTYDTFDAATGTEPKMSEVDDVAVTAARMEEEYKKLYAAAAQKAAYQEDEGGLPPMVVTAVTSAGQGGADDLGGSYYDIYYDSLDYGQADQATSITTATNKGDAIDPTATATGTTAAFNRADLDWVGPLDDILDAPMNDATLEQPANTLDEQLNPLDELFRMDGDHETPYEVLQQRAQALFGKASPYDNDLSVDRLERWGQQPTQEAIQQAEHQQSQMIEAFAAAYDEAVKQLYSAFAALTRGMQSAAQDEVYDNVVMSAPDISTRAAAEPEVHSSVLQMGRMPKTATTRRLLKQMQ